MPSESSTSSSSSSYIENWSSSSSSTSSFSTSSFSTSSAEPTFSGMTYYCDFKDINSINNPKIDNNAKMKFSGHFTNDFTLLDFNKFGYGVKRTKNNKGSIYCNDASKLFSFSKGYLGMTISLPYEITNGIYAPLVDDDSKFNEYMLWGVNIGNFELCQPSLYAALTPRGIEFTIFTSAGKHTIVDSYSNIDANENIFIEFLWNSDNLDNYLIRSAIRVNGVDIATGNGLINNDSIDNLSFYALNTPSSLSNFECSIRKLIAYNKIPDEFIVEWWSSSSSDSSFSSSSSNSSSTPSSNSSDSSSSNSSSSSSSSMHGFTWTIQDGSGQRYWVGIASSSDGSRLVAADGISSGYIYTSQNYGVSWTARTSSSDTWLCLDSSSNGLMLVAIEDFGYIYTSSNGGSNWTKRVAAGQRFWHSIANSYDGQKIVSTTESDGLFLISTNGGVNWIERSSPISGGLMNMSSDGSTIIFAPDYCTYTIQPICISKDDGLSWSYYYHNKRVYAYDICCSSDGTKIYICGNGNISCTGIDLPTGSPIIYSLDSGLTWIASSIPQSEQIYDIACSNDGARIIACGFNTIWHSKNYGSSWSIVLYNATYSISDICSSSDGERVAASMFNNYIFTGTYADI